MQHARHPIAILCDERLVQAEFGAQRRNAFGVAFVPAMTAATSPGNTRSITNTSADRPTKAATNSASRFPTNRMEIPFPYLFLEIRHNGSTVWLSLLGKPCTCLLTATVTR